MTKKFRDDDDDFPSTSSPTPSDPPPPTIGDQPPTYPARDHEVIHPADAWPSFSSMLDALALHAKTTHGLNVDKEMFLKLHAYLSHHLTALGVYQPAEVEAEE